jgi:transcription-repair coupling factor (superfamily II helicase)
MGAKLPCRLDLFDQEIESIRLFDVSTQRSTETTQAVSLLPAREFATDKNSTTDWQNSSDLIFLHFLNCQSTIVVVV